MTSQNTVIPTAGFTYSPDSGLAIEAHNVSKIYDADGRAHHALKSIDIKVPIGCIFGLLGPNGAGKSTFINIMAGTVVKTSGSISIWGTDIDEGRFASTIRPQKPENTTDWHFDIN